MVFRPVTPVSRGFMQISNDAIIGLTFLGLVVLSCCSWCCCVTKKVQKKKKEPPNSSQYMQCENAAKVITVDMTVA